MQKVGASYKFTIAERKVIKELVDKRYGKISTSTDYQSDGMYNSGIEGEIYKYTGKTISGSTLERLVGLRNEDRDVRKSTLNFLSKYLNFKSSEFLLRKIEYLISNPSQQLVEFELSNIFKNHITKIEFGYNKEILLRFISETTFEIIGAKNTKLMLGDLLELRQIEVEYPLICRNVKRKTEDKFDHIGIYNSNHKNIISKITFFK